MLGLGFAIGIIEDKIENVLANKKLNTETKDQVVDALNDIKEKFHKKKIDKRYTVKVKFGDKERDWATYKDVIELKVTKTGYLWIKTEKKLVAYQFKDIVYFEQEVQNG